MLDSRHAIPPGVLGQRQCPSSVGAELFQRAVGPRVGDAQAFYHRVLRGYMLNELGVGSTAVIDSFDLQQQLLQMFEQKRAVASQVHSDYCRIEGRTVNQ